MRGKNHGTLISPLEELVDPAAHRILKNTDDLFKVHMLAIICFYTEEALAALVVGSHGHSGEEFIDLIITDIQAFQYPYGALFHDVLGARACGYTGHFSPDALPHNGTAKCPSRDCTCMHFDYFMAGGVTDGCLAFDHEFAAHKYLCTVRVFMAVEQLSRNNAAEFLYHIDIAIDCLLEHFIDHFEVSGKVCSLEASWQVDIYVEIGNENDRPFLMAMYFDKFFYIFYPDTAEVYPDVR